MEFLGTVLGVAVACVPTLTHHVQSEVVWAFWTHCLVRCPAHASKARLDMLHALLSVMVLGPSEVHVG